MSRDREIDATLARAVVYQWLAEGFAPPAPSTIERVTSARGLATIAGAARLLDDAPKTALAEALPLVAPRLSLEELRAAYTRLFGHTARGEVPPYETEYGEHDIFRQPQELADLSGFFRAFGLSSEGRRERCDHVSRECEFLGWLSLKQAFALEHQDQAMLAEVLKARRLFLRDHLGCFAPALGRRLMRADGGGFYGALGAVLERFVVAECALEQVAAGPLYLKLGDTDSPEVPTACVAASGTCEAAEQCSFWQPERGK